MKKAIRVGISLMVILVLALWITFVIVKYKENERKKMVWQSFFEIMGRDVDSGSIDTGDVKWKLRIGKQKIVFCLRFLKKEN